MSEEAKDDLDVYIDQRDKEAPGFAQLVHIAKKGLFPPPGITTEEDLDEVLSCIETLWGSPQGTPDGDELAALMQNVADYEAAETQRQVLLACLEYGFYPSAFEFSSEADAAENAVSTFREHRKHRIYAHFSFGGPMHPAPPGICTQLHEELGVFMLATAACELSNYEDVWAQVYNAVARRWLERSALPRISVLRTAITFSNMISGILTPREIIEMYVVNGKTDYENEYMLAALIEKEYEETRKRVSKRG